MDDMVKAPGILMFLWLLEIRLACRKKIAAFGSAYT